MPTKERTKENCRCCDAADPRLRGCTPLRTPIRKSEGPLATRTQYYCSRLTPTGLPPLLSRVLRGCERGATVERSETGERAMFAPAGQTTARAGLRSKLAALVVRRQAPPNPRRGKRPPCQRGLAALAAWGIPTGLAKLPVTPADGRESLRLACARHLPLTREAFLAGFARAKRLPF